MRLEASQLRKVEKISYSPEGGVLVKFEGEKYPVHGALTDESLWATEMLKKYVIGWASMAYLLNPLILTKWGTRRWLRQFDRYSKGVVERYAVPELFSPAVKEFYNVGLYLWPEETSSIKAVCLILENDKAYRWRWQDIMMAGDRKALIHHPIRETVRLVGIYRRREHYRHLPWITPYVVGLLLFTRPDIRRAVRWFATEAKFDELALDRYDLQQCMREEAYDYDDKGIEERLDIVNRL